MNAIDFCYSLQGFAELTLDSAPNSSEWKKIVNLLNAIDQHTDTEEVPDEMVMAKDFVRWLNGWILLADSNHNGIEAEQWTIIKGHLGIVFNKITPDREIDHVSEIKRAVEEFSDVVEHITTQSGDNSTGIDKLVISEKTQAEIVKGVTELAKQHPTRQCTILPCKPGHHC